MPRPEKVAAVAEIKQRIEGAKAVFLAEYAGLSVKEQQELRRGLKAHGAEFKVVKMTLARRAVDELEIDAFEGLLLGPTGIAFADEDAVSTAKVLKDFSSSHEVFTVKGGLLGGDPLTPERISELAEIEPRDVLLARLAGAMKAPMNNMASLLAALPRSVATMVQQLIDKKVAAGESAEPDGALAAVDEAAADKRAAEELTPPRAEAGAEPAAEDAAGEEEAVPEEDAASDDAAPAAEDSATDDDSEPKVDTAADDAAEPQDTASAEDADADEDDAEGDTPEAEEE